MYLQGVCENFGIVDNFQLNTEVIEARWLEEAEEWEITLAYLVPGTGDLTARERQARVSASGYQSVYQMEDTVRAKILVSGAGKLVQPNGWPEDIPGIDSFEGDLIHTARWDESIDLNDKDVVVVGSGCSAAQVVPQLIKPQFNARSVTQIMRTPPWVVPSILSPKNLEKWDKYVPWLLKKVPILAHILRMIVYFITEMSFIRIFSPLPFGAYRRANYERKLLKSMKNGVPEKYHSILTPNYTIGCKRRVFDVEWFKSLHRSNVELTTLPLKSVQQRSITLGHGPSTPDHAVPGREVQIPADTIILANGYQMTSWFHPLTIKGREGKDLNELWNDRGGVQAYLTVAMDKFPNFFLIYGPNTSNGHTSVLLAIENAVNYSLKFIEPIINGNISIYEVREEAVIAWTDQVQTALRASVWINGGCKSWYKTEDGWNGTTYP